MKKTKLILLGLMLATFHLTAAAIDVTTVTYVGPYAIHNPFMIDSTNVNAARYAATDLLNTPLNLDAWQTGTPREVATLLNGRHDQALHLIAFNIENTSYTHASIHVEGLTHHQLYVDGQRQTNGRIALEPSGHTVVIKYLTSSTSTDEQVKITVEGEKEGDLSVLTPDAKHKYNISDVLHGTHFTYISLSPNGRYLLTSYNTTLNGGQTIQKTRVEDLQTHRTLTERTYGLRWMPRTNKYYYMRENTEGHELVTVDPADGTEQIIARNIPKGSFRISPTEDFLIYTIPAEGPKENVGVYEVITPDDRQPGWRTRTNLSKYDLKTGLMQPLTFGHSNVSLEDISSDGKYLLIQSTHSRLTARPTTVNTLYRMDLQTMQAEILVADDGFIEQALFSPDGNDILVKGSPEALGGIGQNVAEGQVPSMTDKQLYLLRGHEAIPLTRDFDPSVSQVVWNRHDGNIYFTAEDKDSVNLFQLNPKNHQIVQLKCTEELIQNFTMASAAPQLAYFGVSASNSDRSYVVALKSQRETLHEDLSRETLKHVEIGECKAWTFTNRRGETIYGRYYLPADFDATRKYPMIVNYYGGCLPTSRTFEGRYPQHAYASLGYVVLIINPSGATGFGQQFSARHVNTAGQGVAEDIIDGTLQFCREHDYVNARKIGCIGASYGGFMTQYLQTVTDIFAAAVSHAGISDHTSYWGEGYWGYSYSEVSMANSYPWTDRQLYVDQSPLFRADKIHTPLLFLHGDADTNVPVGESIQMYTALKLLGRETAMVLVKDQNHHILDYQKRIRWQNTIFAWFAKYLQDDSAWWESMYPKKEL